MQYLHGDRASRGRCCACWTGVCLGVEWAVCLLALIPAKPSSSRTLTTEHLSPCQPRLPPFQPQRRPTMASSAFPGSMLQLLSAWVLAPDGCPLVSWAGGGTEKVGRGHLHYPFLVSHLAQPGPALSGILSNRHQELDKHTLLPRMLQTMSADLTWRHVVSQRRYSLHLLCSLRQSVRLPSLVRSPTHLFTHPLIQPTGIIICLTSYPCIHSLFTHQPSIH